MSFIPFTIFTIFCIFFIFDIFCIFRTWLDKKYRHMCPQPLPKAEKDIKDDEQRALTGEDYDLVHNRAYASDFDDGVILDFFTGKGSIFCTLKLVCTAMSCVFHSLFMSLELF